MIWEDSLFLGIIYYILCTDHFRSYLVHIYYNAHQTTRDSTIIHHYTTLHTIVFVCAKSLFSLRPRRVLNHVNNKFKLILSIYIYLYIYMYVGDEKQSCIDGHEHIIQETIAHQFCTSTQPESFLESVLESVGYRTIDHVAKHHNMIHRTKNI